MKNAMEKQNCLRIDMKRKCFARGRTQRFKRFKKTPKFIRDNVENQIAKEKDVYEFSDSDDDERADELGMGLEISDLPLLMLEDDCNSDKHKAIVALTQDSVAPLFRNESEVDEQKLNDALNEFRLTQFRPNQIETIKRILMGRSTLFISPTGSGKSLCYQLPALLYWRFRKYITIVVSPLISLMEDQIKNIPSMLKAVTIHSNQNKQQRRNSIEQLVNNDAQIAFITPEAIVGGLLELDDLKNLPAVGFVCIDEAHCLSEWSHHFRPAYLQFMRILNEQLGIKTYLALTATATRATTFDISKSLTINPETDVIGSTTIPGNLILSVSYEANKDKAIIKLLQSPTFRIMPSIIVYCSRREDTERVAATIRTAMQDYSSTIEVPEKIKRDNRQAKETDDGSSPESKPQMKLTWQAETYHAGLPSHIRASIQRRFIKGEIRVVVATIAFGMGINKSNVRAIIHYDMPRSFESYVQEIGRAGRDGKPAQCHMFLRADKGDVYYQQRNIYSSVTEYFNIEKLTDFIFQPCVIGCFSKKEIERLAKFNEADPHEIKSWHKTPFTNVPICCEEDDIDDHELPHESLVTKENRPMKYAHKSIVRRHRPCKGHEVSVSIEEITQALNLFPEAIITFLCKLERAYPQLKIRQFPPIKPDCTLICYKGPEQMEQLANECPAVREGLRLDKQNYIKRHGSATSYETPNKIKFDLTYIARRLAKSSAEVMKMLRKTEWELDDKSGRFRRTQVRVRFDGNAFHLMAVGDLTPDEIKEIKTFLRDEMRRYERVERNKVLKMYQTLRRYAIGVDQMKDKIVRLNTSMKLKAAIDAYFNQSSEKDFVLEFAPVELDDNDVSEQTPTIEQEVKKKVREFVTAHGREHFSSRAIAKIFQGVSCPHFPAEHWGMNRNWWRTFLDIDFLKLVEIIHKVLA